MLAPSHQDRAGKMRDSAFPPSLLDDRAAALRRTRNRCASGRCGRLAARPWRRWQRFRADRRGNEAAGIPVDPLRVPSCADALGVAQSQGQVEALIAREKTRSVTAARIVVAGFSQGGAIALYTGLRHAERLAGIVGLSTYLPMADRLPAEAAKAN